MIVAGDCQGNLYRIFYKLPQKPYTTAEEVQVAICPTVHFVFRKNAVPDEASKSVILTFKAQRIGLDLPFNTLLTSLH